MCLVAAGLAGVWEAGLWNIASSNIINFILMSLAVGWNRQERELFNWRFLDEIVFASLPIVVPLVLMWYSFDERWTVIPVLLLFFGLYRIVDSRVNRTESHSAGEQAAGSLGIGLSLTATALVALAIAGFFLGGATENVVNRIGINPAIAGWILGFTSSLPEVITFFSVYGRARAAGKLESLADTQEVLDNLTASNMANVGVVYPVGVAGLPDSGRRVTFNDRTESRLHCNCSRTPTDRPVYSDRRPSAPERTGALLLLTLRPDWEELGLLKYVCGENNQFVGCNCTPSDAQWFMGRTSN